MDLEKSLTAIASFVPNQFDNLRRSLDPAWVLQALEDTGTVSLRKRKLPAEQMVWLVIGMALIRNRPIAEVAQQLDLSIGASSLVSKAAVAQARARLGAQSLQWLCAQSGRCWARRSAKDDTFLGLKIYGVDGTTLRVADSLQNAEHFGYSLSKQGESAYPLVRLVVLMALRSHVMAAAAFGPYQRGELHYASQLWGQLEDDTVTLVDRGFLAAPILLGIARSGNNRHWLTRAKSSTKFVVVKKLGVSDAIVEMKVSHDAQSKDPSLPLTWQARAITYQRKGFAPQILLTSMTDSKAYPAEDIVGLYHERWELELGYDELKTVMLDRQETIRSKTPKMVEQELWGILLAYNLVRLEMLRVSEIVTVPAVRISFVMTLRLVCDEWSWSNISGSPGAIPRHLRDMRDNLTRFVLPERRAERTYPRAVKIKMSGYPRKRRVAAVK